MNKQKTDIFNFSDYRSFLLSHYESEKERWSDFSYNIWAKKLELKNNTSIIKIIKGQRNAGPEIIEKLSCYFEFNKKQKEYFEGLVRLEKIKDDNKLKVLLMQDLQKLNHRNSVVLIDDKKFETISSPYSFTLRQMARIGTLKKDFKSIQDKLLFKVPLNKLKKIVKNLIHLNLLKETESSFECLTFSLKTSEDIASEALKQFHEEALDIAKEAIRKVDPLEREISAVTLNFDQSKIKEAKEMISDFEDQFLAKFGDSKNASHVYQMQLQLFPLTKNIGEQSENTLH